MSTSPVKKNRLTDPSRVVLIPLIFVAGLIVYKSRSSIRAVLSTWTEGALSTRPDVVEFGGGTLLVAFQQSLNYAVVILPALTFGILISAAVRAYIRPDLLVRVLGGRGIAAQLRAAAAGAPLMLCSCCVAPIFNVAYERGLRLASSITLMLASPSLNPAALLLTFILLPTKVAIARLVMAVLAVLCVGLIVEALSSRRPAQSIERAAGSVDGSEEAAPAALRLLESVLHVSIRTVPALAIGVVGSMVLVQYVPAAWLSSDTFQILAVTVTAAVAVPLALPTFFEIPLALGLIAAGAPEGAALTLLIAGPAVNLPSLLTLARATSWKTAVTLALLIWAIAVTGGLAI